MKPKVSERKVLLAAEAFGLMNRVINIPELWTEPRLKSNLRILQRYLRRYHALTDDERDVYEICAAAARKEVQP